MKQLPLLDLVSDIIDDMRSPGMLWQTGAIIACIALGWLLARLLSAFRRAPAVPAAGTINVVKVVAPLLILMLLAISRYFLVKWQHVHLLNVALPVFGSLAVLRCGFYLLRRVFARQGHVGVAILTFEKIFAALVWLGLALYITGWWPDLLQYLRDNTLPLGRNRVPIATILQALVSVFVLLILAMWAGSALEERLMKVEGMHSSLRVVMARMARAILILASILLSLSLVGIDLTVLSVFGGALGVGLGLGMQKIASNYVSGFIILLDRSLTIGDVITVDKYSGKVTQINTRYTVLQGLDGIESILPNEMLVSSPVQNFSLSNRSMRIATHVHIGFDSDLDLVLSLLEQAAASVGRVSVAPAPFAMLVRFAPYCLEVELGFWISDPENGSGGALSEVNIAIWRTLKAHQIAMSYPQQEIRMAASEADAALDLPRATR